MQKNFSYGDIIICKRQKSRRILCVFGQANLRGGKIKLRREPMDNKTKKIIFVIVASIISLISTVVGIVFGVPQDAIKDAVDIDTGIVETL